MMILCRGIATTDFLNGRTMKKIKRQRHAPREHSYSLPKEVCGIPVHVDMHQRQHACAVGVWPFKKIVVGENFFYLQSGERQAVLMHEVGHSMRFHAERRIGLFFLSLLSPLLWIAAMRAPKTDDINSIEFDSWVSKHVPQMILARCAEHEHEADEFAVRLGYGVELLSHISRARGHQGAFYPSIDARVNRIQQVIGSMTWQNAMQ